MISFTHGIEQLAYLEWKAKKLNSIFGRSCKVGAGSYIDKRSGKEYRRAQFAITSQLLDPLYEEIYVNGKKTYSSKWLSRLGLEELAVVWMDDGNLEPKKRVGRLNVYEDKSQCQIIANWIQSLCGAIGRYEDYENNGTGRLRYPPTEMVKIVNAIRQFMLPEFNHKIALQYQRNHDSCASDFVANPPSDLPYSLNNLPLLESLTYNQWRDLAKLYKVARSNTVSETKEYFREVVKNRLNEIEKG